MITSADVFLALASGGLGAIGAQLLSMWHTRRLETERNVSTQRLEVDRQTFMQQLETERNAFAQLLEAERKTFMQHKQSLHTLRIQLFAEMMGHRNWVTGEPFSAALNRVMGLFFDDEKVVRSVRELVGAKQTEKDARLVAVFRTIADNLGISNQTFTDRDFLTAFNVRDHGFVLSAMPTCFNGQPSGDVSTVLCKHGFHH